MRQKKGMLNLAEQLAYHVVLGGQERTNNVCKFQDFRVHKQATTSIQLLWLGCMAFEVNTQPANYTYFVWIE